jgi:hypothetical protein
MRRPRSDLGCGAVRWMDGDVMKVHNYMILCQCNKHVSIQVAFKEEELSERFILSRNL